MTSFPLAARVAGVILAWPTVLAAQLSSQGFTGFINVPSAEVSPRGWVEYQYNDQVDSRSSSSIRTADNYLFSVGLAPGWEFGGRLLNQGPPGFGSNTNTFRDRRRPADRDLSAQTKIQLFSHQWLPSFAVGAQDFGGNQQRSSEYAVLGDRYNWFEYAIGVGTDRKSGVFWGLGFHPSPYASLLIDDDNNQRSMAVRASTGRLWRYQQLSAYWRFVAEGPQDDSFFGVTWSLSLGGQRWRRPHTTGQPPGTMAADEAAGEVVAPTPTAAPVALPPAEQLAAQQAQDEYVAPPVPVMPGPAPREPVRQFSAQALEVCADKAEARMRQLDLERASVRFDSRNDAVAVTFEGRSYPRSDVDALGVALGALTRTCQMVVASLDTIHVRGLQNGLTKYSLSLPAAATHAYFQAQPAPPPVASATIGKSPFGHFPAASARDTWVEVSLDPVINYAIGTEFGVFDYSAGLETNIRVPLWPGSEVTARRRDEFAASDDYDGPRRRFNNQRIRSEWDSFLFQQVVTPAQGLFLAGYYGQTSLLGFDADTYGGEVAYSPLPSGKLQFYSKYINYDKGEQIFDNRPLSERESWTGTVRGYSPRLNTALDVTWGQFVFGDEGTRITFRRYFGDAVIGLVYKATKGREDEAVGFSFSTALTPRRSKRVGPVQFQGNPAWGTFVQTLFNVDTNFLRPNLISEILPGNNLQTDWFDRGRLSPAYINASWARMLDVWNSQKLR